MGKQVKKHGYSCKLVRVVDGDVLAEGPRIDLAVKPLKLTANALGND